MPRILYLCPADNAPTGGIKVIYRHAELLADLGTDTAVLHPFETTFRCTWFEHRTRFEERLTLDPAQDFVVIPELWAGNFGPQCLAQGVRYAVFVQNGYFTHPIIPGQDDALLSHAYASADLVLSISDDTSRVVALNYPSVDPARIVRVQYAVHDRFIAAARKSAGRVITYMPRKMGDHAGRVVFALSQHLPAGWSIVPIHNVDEARCAELLFASRIFLSFSHFEGLPCPPLEAALAGNVVVGYTGQGAKEYWRAPNFIEVEQGDIIGFVEAASAVAARMDGGGLGFDVLEPGIDALAERFSLRMEKAGLERMLARIAGCFARPVPRLAAA